jgi:predicted AlkP superfamily phosphohydrolase/phosphomutase
MILVLGIDAATWTVIRPNLDKLPSFARLCHTGRCSDLVLQEMPISPSVWCSMFCGKPPEEHKHGSFVSKGKLVRRQDIQVDFIWDILDRKGRKVKALNVPFVVPPYSFGVDFRPVGFGLPTNDKEWQEELQSVTQKVKQLIDEGPDVLIAVYTSLDRIQHFHWGEPCVLDWYRKLDSKIGELVFDTRFLDKKDSKLIVISDHGFCSFGESRVRTLPVKSDEGELKGDHHENAVLITVNLDDTIDKPQDVFSVILRETRS